MRRFIELVVRVRRLVARAPERGTLTQFSFRLAFMIDIAYVGMGALGGVAIARAPLLATPPAAQSPVRACRVDPARQGAHRWMRPNVDDAARPGGASDM